MFDNTVTRLCLTEQLCCGSCDRYLAIESALLDIVLLMDTSRFRTTLGLEFKNRSRRSNVYLVSGQLNNPPRYLTANPATWTMQKQVARMEASGSFMTVHHMTELTSALHTQLLTLWVKRFCHRPHPCAAMRLNTRQAQHDSSKSRWYAGSLCERSSAEIWPTHPRQLRSVKPVGQGSPSSGLGQRPSPINPTTG